MSFLPVESSTNRNDPKSQTVKFEGTTTMFRRDFELERSQVYISARVDNLDPTNNLLMRQSPNGIQTIIPPNTSAAVEDEINAFLELIPDGTSGKFQFEVALSFKSDLQRLGLI